MRPDVSIVTSGHDVADARLHREVAALRRLGLAVEVIGLGDASAGPDGAEVRTAPRAGSAARAWRALAWPWRAKGRILVALDPDSTFGAVMRCRLGALIGRRRRSVADVHEDYLALLRDRAWASGAAGLAGALWARLGVWAARHADLLVVADEHLLPGEPRRIVLRNLPDRSMLPPPGDPAPTPRAVYVGDLRRSRGLFAMLDAVEAAPGWELDLVGPIAGDDRDEALTRIAGPALADRVRWHDRLPPREAWAVAEGAWAGLLLLDDTPAFREAMPSKLYEYLASGLPVVTSDLPRPAALVRQTGAGVVVDDAPDAARHLMAWAQDTEGYGAVRKSALAAGRAFSSTDEVDGFAAAVGLLAPSES